MKRLQYIITLLLIVALICPSIYSKSLEKSAFSGKVVERKTGKGIPGAVLYFPDLKTGTSTDDNGEFRMLNLPASKTVIQVSSIGFRSIIESVDLSNVVARTFEMDYSATELNEVVVTGLTKASEQKRNPTPVSVVSAKALRENASSNIIDAITSQPGISQVSTGAAISKPVIRGLGYNRVVVINDGVRQEGQQWGDEHGIEIDESDVGKVEILKGPASLVYGSDAMAGVVNMIAFPTTAEGKVEGVLTSNFQTNNGLIGNSFNLVGNKKGLVWDVRLSDKRAHAYQNRYDGYVFNTGFRENAASGSLGFLKSWGFSNFKLSYYHLQPGIAEGERDSATGKFIKPVALSNSEEGTALATDKDNHSYTPSTPYQQISHYKAVWNNNIYLTGGNVLATVGFQQNRRQEFADVLHPNDYQLYFLLNTLTYDVRYNLSEKNHFNISFGVNGMQQSSRNKGVEFLVPEYHLFDVGLFSILKKNFGNVDISGGVRFDRRSQQSKDLYLDESGQISSASNSNATRRFAAFDNVFTGLSGSLGATWQLSKSLYTKINLSRGFRAPNISELGANGVHEGTIRYELGDAHLQPEKSLQLDYTFGINTEHVSAELNLFDNAISNYIFLHKLESTTSGDSLQEGQLVFKYTSGNAHLWGGEFRIDVHPHPLDWLHIENAFSFVQASQSNQPDSMRNLPLTPAPKWQFALKAEFDRCGKHLRNSYAKLETERYFTQNKVYSAFGTETPTPGYTLLNAGLGTDVVKKNRTLFSVYLNANNLLDVGYQNHLSRLKYAAVNNATGRAGVYNMGRNVSVKIIVPLNF